MRLKKKPPYYTLVFLLPHIHCEFTSYTETLDGTILKMSNSPRSNMIHKQFGWGILFLCECLKPMTLSHFRWVSLKEKNKWTDLIGSSKHIAAFRNRGWVLGFFGLFFFPFDHAQQYLDLQVQVQNFCNVLQTLHGKKPYIVYDSSCAVLKH